MARIERRRRTELNMDLYFLQRNWLARLKRALSNQYRRRSNKWTTGRAAAHLPFAPDAAQKAGHFSDNQRARAAPAVFTFGPEWCSTSLRNAGQLGRSPAACQAGFGRTSRCLSGASESDPAGSGRLPPQIGVCEQNCDACNRAQFYDSVHSRLIHAASMVSDFL